ncbi:MAG: hypothetical protein ABJB65_02440 [Chloroflexota bacterium]
MADPQAAEDDPFADLQVERVERADGRYLLYYSWPRRSEPAAPSPTDQPADEPDV